MDESYNSVPIWDYGTLFQAFGPSFKTKHYLVKTPNELDTVLANAEFNEASYGQVSQLCLPIIFATFSLFVIDCRVDSTAS